MQKYGIGVWLAAVLIPAALSAQSDSPPVPRLQLRVTNVTVVQGMQAKSTWSPLRCDREGNVYLRFYDMAAIRQAPVVRISSDGEDKQEFSLASVPGSQQAEIETFAVAPDGEVGLAVWGPKVDDGKILMFKSDGTFDSDATIKMGPRNTFQMAIFSNGNLLVSGTKEVGLYGKDQPPISAPFTEVLNDAGDLIKEFTLRGDYESPKPSDPVFEKSLRMQPTEITLGDAVAGADGNVYLTRHFGDPTVYVIAPDGSVVRKLRLVPASKAQSYSGIHFSSEGGGQLAVQFSMAETGSNTSASLISTYSAETGQRLMDYEVPHGVGTALACYNSNGFTFVGSNEQHQLAIKEVKPY